MSSKQTPGVICFLTHIKTDFLHSNLYCIIILLLCNFLNTYINIYNANVCDVFFALFFEKVLTSIKYILLL